MKTTVKQMIRLTTLHLCLFLLSTLVAAQKAELVVQTGHSEPVRAIAFSKDGKFLASAAGSEKTVKIWNVATGQELRTLIGHPAFIQTVDFSPNGKILASAGARRSIKLWDPETGQEIRSIDGQSSSSNSILFSPNGKFIASAGSDGIVRFWDTETGEELKAINGHRGAVLGIAFNPDGTILASAGTDRLIKLWNVESGKEMLSLDGHSRNVQSVAFSPDGSSLASSSDDKLVKIWDVKSGKELRTLAGHTFKVTSVSFSPDGKTLASSSLDDSVKLWEVATGNEIKSTKNDFVTYSQVAFSPVENQLAVSGNDGNSIELWDVSSGKTSMILEGHSFDVASVVFSANGKMLASVNRDRTIKLWDLSGENELKSLNGHELFVPAVAFSPEGELLTSVSWDKTIKLWSVASGRMLESYDLNPSISRGELLVEFAGFYERNYKEPLQVYPKPISDKLVAQRAENGKINLFDRKSGKPLATLFALDENDWAVVSPEGLFDASPNGRKLMHYIIGLESISLDQMKDAYYVPGLLKKIYNGEPLPKVDLFSKTDLFPNVELQQTVDNKINVKLENRGGGIGNVQILVNGKELSSDAITSDKLSPNSEKADLKIDLSKAPSFIPGEENKIEVVARNSSGSLNSRGSSGSSMSVAASGKKNENAPDLYAIVSGISDFTGDDLDLQFAAKDAEDFAKVLEMGAISLLGSTSNVHIRLLTSNGANAPVKFSASDSKIYTATKADFLRAFEDFRGAKPKDVFIVYLAGHGVSLNLNQTSNSFGGDKYLFLTQEATTYDKSVLANENARKAMTLSGDELKDLMKQNGALKQVLILDTCAAGAYSYSLVGKRDLPSDQIRALENLKDSTGFHVLMGSSADSVSYEASQYGQGLLTYSLLQAMKGANLRENQFANVSMLFNYAQETVPELAKNISGIQRPVVISPNVSGSFDIGRFTELERKEIKLETPKPLVLRPNLQNEELRFDNLNLTPMLTKALRESSFVMKRGEKTSPTVFVDTNEMADGIIPSGTYRVEGGIIFFKIVLVRNNSKLGNEISISGKSSDTKGLINLLVEKINQESSRLAKNF